jgi:hypothetical protein
LEAVAAVDAIITTLVAKVVWEAVETGKQTSPREAMVLHTLEVVEEVHPVILEAREAEMVVPVL